MEAMLQKMARQLASMDEASLMALWDTYHSRVKQFEPTHSWQEACIVLGMIQSVRWKNQLFNTLWAEQKQAGDHPSEGEAQSSDENKSDLISSSDRGKIIQFLPRGES
ncbi:MAG: hypothetical protein KGY41_05805 [Desulfovermiculus sp.]|nr:hypothetical protein [Desulfovermiculus sp.]